MADKRTDFKLKADEIKPLVSRMGGCFATNMITIDGKPVNFMYREKPDHDMDSGWRFFSGFEDDDYANDGSNIQIYDVNTIANYDEDIIPFLNSPFNTAFERNQKTKIIDQISDFSFS